MKHLLALFWSLVFVTVINAQVAPKGPPQNWFYGYVDNDYGYTLNNLAPNGHCLVGNGTMYVDAPCPGASGTITPSCLSNTVYVSQQTGTDASLKIQNAVSAVCNFGTVIVDLSGAQTWSINPLLGVSKQVTLQFQGCSTNTLDAGITLNGYATSIPSGQRIVGAGRNCTILQDGSNSITVLNEDGGTSASDLSINYNGHSNVIAIQQASYALLRRVTINGGFPTYAIDRSGGPGTGIFSARTEDVVVNGNGTAPQFGLAEISTPIGYVGLNQDTNLAINGTSNTAYYLDGGDSGGPTSCHNCDLGGNSGIGLHVVNAIAKVDGDCEGNTGANVIVDAQAPPTNLNAASQIHCASATEIFNTVMATGTIANSSNSMSVTGLSGDIQPGTTLAVTGATFANSGTYGSNTYYDQVTAFTGSTVTFKDATTSGGGVSSVHVYGPITAQWLQNLGTPTDYTTDYYTEAQEYIESPFIRRPTIEGITFLYPELDNPTLQRFVFKNGLQDLYFTDSSYNPIAYMHSVTHSIEAVGGFTPDSYTVATLPSCDGSILGLQSAVTDATAPTYLGVLVGSGTVYTPVVCNGTSWVSY